MKLNAAPRLFQRLTFKHAMARLVVVGHVQTQLQDGQGEALFLGDQPHVAGGEVVDRKLGYLVESGYQHRGGGLAS